MSNFSTRPISESLVVGRKTPLDGKLEISPALAAAIGGPGSEHRISIQGGGRDVVATLTEMECACARATTSGRHKHVFLQCDAFRQLSPGTALHLEAEQGRVAVAFSRLPGSDMIESGIADLTNGVKSVAALLVSIGARSLRQSGYTLPPTIPEPEHALYLLLARDDPDSAHSRYNALVRRLVSFERALACAS